MKKVMMIGAALVAAMTAFAAVNVDRIDPPNWYAGMKQPSLQLMVYGAGIRDANVSVNYSGARIDSVVRGDSTELPAGVRQHARRAARQDATDL